MLKVEYHVNVLIDDNNYHIHTNKYTLRTKISLGLTRHRYHNPYLSINHNIQAYV